MYWWWLCIGGECILVVTIYWWWIYIGGEYWWWCLLLFVGCWRHYFVQRTTTMLTLLMVPDGLCTGIFIRLVTRPRKEFNPRTHQVEKIDSGMVNAMWSKVRGASVHIELLKDIHEREQNPRDRFQRGVRRLTIISALRRDHRWLWSGDVRCFGCPSWIWDDEMWNVLASYFMF